MSIHNLTPNSEKVEELHARGFTHNFVLEEDTVLDADDQTHYVPEQVAILGEFREEGMSDPGDMSVVLALRAPDGVLGTMVTAYGPEGEHGDVLRRLGQEATADHEIDLTD